MNFEQARGAIEDAKNHDELLRAMEVARAPAHWSQYTESQQQELCNAALIQSSNLASRMRSKIFQDEERIKKAVRNMANSKALVI